MFAPSIYQKRREKLMQILGNKGVVLLPGNDEAPMNYSANVYPFRQDSNFLYFIGLDQPNLTAVIDLDKGRTTLYGDNPDIEDIVWEGPKPDMATLAGLSEIEHTASHKSLIERLNEDVKTGTMIYYAPPYRADNVLKLHHWLGYPLQDIKNRSYKVLNQAIVNLRSYKEEGEIAEMELALSITREMHMAAMQQARPGMFESDLAGMVQGIAFAKGAGPAYGTILSVNGQTLHNPYHGNRLEAGRLILGDFGAETRRRYAGDITRTFPVSASFTTMQRDIYQVVLEAEMKAIEACRPGVPYVEVHLLASKVIAEGLKSLGLMRGNTDDAVSEGAHALFFPHGLGHMIGLDVHDMENLGEQHVGYGNMERSKQFGTKYLRLARPLEPGFVFTVEPGIYFIPELFDQWNSQGKFKEFIHYEKLDAYRNFGGIRIEDNVLITESGYRVLGPPIPKTVEEVESLRAG